LQRGSGGESLLIQKLSTAPVRAFITAGTAGETVPARSDFAVAFAEALNDGLADSNRDGYSTGTELGVYLQSRIGPLGQQTPWFGKIPDPALAQGDFVFRSGRAGPSEPSLPRLASLTVVSSPAGASVYVDGQLEGISPVTLTNLPTGRRRIELRADGFTASQTNVELQSGDSHTISADLKPVQNVGRLTVTSNPEFARITFVDSGRDYQPGMELPQGNYSLRITATDFKSRDVLVKMFESDVSLFVDLAPETARVAQLGERGQRSVSGLPSIPLYGSAPRTPTCFARNTMGASFWWNGPDLYSAQWQAIRVCQMSTPPGAFCQLTSCQ
jgi:hypothetical protein